MIFIGLSHDIYVRQPFLITKNRCHSERCKRAKHGFATEESHTGTKTSISHGIPHIRSE